MSRIIELKSDDQETLIPLINKAIYHKGKGTIDIRLDEDLREYLLQLKDNFTSIKVNDLFNLSSTYAMRIYELLVQYRRIGERTIELSELRKMLNIPPDQYQRFQHFDTRILKKAQYEINTKTELAFSYEKIRKNRSIYSIKFVFAKKKAIKNNKRLTERHATLVDELAFYGVTDTKANELINTDSAKVQEALDSIKTQNSTINNPAG